MPGWTGAQPQRLLHACLHLHDDTYMMPLPLEAPCPWDSGLTPTPRSCLWLPGRSRPVLGPLPGGCLPLPEASDRMEDMANKPVPAGSRAGAGSQVGGSLLSAGAPPVARLQRDTQKPVGSSCCSLPRSVDRKPYVTRCQGRCCPASWNRWTRLGVGSGLDPQTGWLLPQ